MGSLGPERDVATWLRVPVELAVSSDPPAGYRRSENKCPPRPLGKVVAAWTGTECSLPVSEVPLMHPLLTQLWGHSPVLPKDSAIPLLEIYPRYVKRISVQKLVHEVML